MTPEAKQAAGQWVMEGNSNVAAHQAYAEGYDAATAKLREELEHLERAAKELVADASKTNEPFPSAVIRQSKLAKLQAAVARVEKGRG